MKIHHCSIQCSAMCVRERRHCQVKRLMADKPATVRSSPSQLLESPHGCPQGVVVAAGCPPHAARPIVKASLARKIMPFARKSVSIEPEQARCPIDTDFRLLTLTLRQVFLQEELKASRQPHVCGPATTAGADLDANLQLFLSMARYAAIVVVADGILIDIVALAITCSSSSSSLPPSSYFQE